MLRDFKFLRRNSGKNQDLEEIENVPINPNDDSSRDSLLAIPEKSQNPKGNVEQEMGVKSSKFEKTPVKSKGRVSETATLPLRTPERQGNGGNVGRNRFGFSSLNEGRDEARSETASYLSQSGRNGGSLNLTPRVCGGAGTRGGSSVHSESTSTQSTPTKSVSKPPNPGFAPMTSSRHHGSARGGTYGALSRRFSVTGGQQCVVNTVDVPHFDLKEDPSFWMDHNVQVIIRVRPLNNFERNTYGYNRCVKQDGAQSISWIGQPETRFTFDHVACETVDQEMLFRMAGLPMVENCLSGYNSCMFAYGQTGSGKTYTMLGEMEDFKFKPSPHRGMTPRIFEFLFARIRAEEESRSDEKLKYSCKCSFLEIYNEQITDLLDPSSSNLLLREDVKKGVYVENLSEFEVHTVADVLRLLIQGSSNRKVAATNMNRESSRSHSVFTCKIESEWEKDSATNLRFARLNLVDLAGSERQKSSGAEGERLKEAANINKSLSTLGHVIMLLVDIAHGKPKHVPYRDSRLTFLLQDSLGGNSKTMIIANISPSICCAAETLNTLKFAQRAKLIQNNAVVNEDSSGDVAALQRQICLLKEELSALRRQNVSRNLAFDASSTVRGQENTDSENRSDSDEKKADELLGAEKMGGLRVSSKQLKTLETMLAGAMRREQMAETSIRQLEAEIEQLNRLVRQREEDTQCSKMMLKFREDKIQRMESLLSDLKPVDPYLLEENAALSEEIQMLRAKVDKNPEVTRFARENIRLLEQLRRYQDFYEEGEREILLEEVSELRAQLIRFIDNGHQQYNHAKVVPDTSSNIDEDQCLRSELTNTLKELAECRSKLKSCLDSNSKLSREIEDLQALLRNKEPEIYNDSANAVKVVGDPHCTTQAFDAVQKEKCGLTGSEEMVNLELELDILKIILKEERLSRSNMEEMTSSLIRDVRMANDRVLSINKQCEDTKRDLKEAKSVIEALESQQLLSINEIEELKNLNSHYEELLQKQKLEFSALKEKTYSCFKHPESEVSPVQVQLKRMQASLDKARKLNKWYQCDHASQKSNEEEMDEIRQQAEAETAEVIVCLQEELSVLQQRVQESELREKEEENKIKELQETMAMMTQDNEALLWNLQEREMEMKSLTEDWELLSYEIEQALVEGHEALGSASDQFDSNRRGWISEQFGKMMKLISEKELIIEDLSRCLEDANSQTNDLEHMLMSLRGAAMVMTESHQQETYEKEKEILLLRSELSTKSSEIADLEKRMKLDHEQMRRTSDCAIAAFVIVNRLSEVNSSNLDRLRVANNQLQESQDAEKQIDALSKELTVSEGNCTRLRHQLDEQQGHISAMQRRLEENDAYAIAKTKQTLNDLRIGVSEVRSSLDGFFADKASGHPGNETGKETDSASYCVGKDLEAGVSSTDTNNNSEPLTSCNASGKNDVTIDLLRKELESAMGSLKEVQAEMARLSAEKEEICRSERKGRQGMETVKAEVLSLQEAFGAFEKHCDDKILALNHKLQNVEECALDVKSSWWKTKEFLEYELLDSKASAAQKSVEASCLLTRFEEAQDMMKEADVMINGLMIANEAMKLEIEGLRKMNVFVTGERDILVNEVNALQSTNELNHEKCKNLEEQLEVCVSDITSHVEDLESLFSLVQDTLCGAFMSLTQDFNCTKSQLQETVKLMHSSLDGMWSDILEKDCAISVLHLCHMGVLVEAVSGLNAENGLLQHGISESKAVISDLKEHNLKSKEELEICRELKGKLLVEIKNSFDRISVKENKTRELSMKLCGFEEKLALLQQQEELMLEKSSIMGSELAVLVKELDHRNSAMVASLSEQEKLLKSNEEAVKSQAEIFMVELYAKDFELLVLVSQLQQLAHENDDMERDRVMSCSALECLIKDIVTVRVMADLREQLLMDKEMEVMGLQREVEEAEDRESKVLTQLRTLEAEYESLTKNMRMKEVENGALQNRVQDMESESCILLNDLQVKDSEFKSSKDCIDVLKMEILNLQSRIDVLERDLETKRREVDDFQCSQSSTTEALCKKSQDLESYAVKATVLQEENLILRNELKSLKQREFEALGITNSRVETADMQRCEMLKQLDESIEMVVDHMSQDACLNLDILSKFLEELEYVDYMAKDLVSENLSLQEELFRKEEVLSGLLFDLRLLQESAANSKDQKDQIEELAATLDSTEHELALKSHEMDDAVAKLMEQGDRLCLLEMDLEKANDSVKLLSDENTELRSHVEDITRTTASVDKELTEKKSIIDELENELLEMGNTLGQMNEFVESLKNNLDEVTSERDQLQKELVILEEKMETAHVLSEENEAIAVEAQEIAESRRIYAEEKEEEVKLLEKSVEELDSTISVLENKVDVLKGEAERQRIQREELELELQSLKNQMHNVESADGDIKRLLDEKARSLQEALKRIKLLEKELANKDTEIAKGKAHISELTVLAEAQACEYKQKFKELEAMAEQVKAEEASSQERISSSNKLEKNPCKVRGSASPFKAKGSGSPFKAKGSGSPFKCMGLGLSHQLKSEKDEEITAERLRIEELEALAASRQKTIFTLNARLAAAESMTHDTLRDLLGVKLDMSSYATLLDKQLVQKIADKAVDGVESQNPEVKKLRKQLNEFIEERQGWLEEIDRRQAELVAAQIALEKHRQQEQLLTTENEVLKSQIANHKRRVTELEGEVKKLSGQQNLHQRIHHHAKIKEENNALKIQNEDLTARLRRAESFIARIQGDLARLRACKGRSPYIDNDEEERLHNKLKETEKEKLHLGQALYGLCTSILKAAGITKPTSEINISSAEEALGQLHAHLISLRRELEDLKIKNRVVSEKVRLAELKQDSSPFSSRSEDNRQMPRRPSPAPYFSALDR